MRGSNITQNLSLEKKKEFQAKVDKFNERATEMNLRLTKDEARGWDLKFQNYWSNISTSQGHYQKNMEISERLIAHVGKFREASEQVVVNIVNELHKPIDQRLNKPLDHRVIQEDFLVFLDEEIGSNRNMVYFD